VNPLEVVRDEDGFAKSEGVYPVTHILSKRNDEPFITRSSIWTRGKA